MKLRNGTARLWLLTLLVVAMPGAALAQVNVYAEGAYTATNLDVYIYADIAEANPLCSYGVTLNYTPGKFTSLPTATKNDAVWYFGTTSDKKPYMDPDTSTSGKIIFIGGKLDTSNPPTSTTAGVKGTRVLLGKAAFTRAAGQDTDFGITLDLGKTHPPFDNFVTSVSPTTVLDETANLTFSSVTIRERGDANGDGTIDIVDTRVVRQIFLGSSTWVVFADCDGDGTIDITDTRCIRNKFLNP